MGIFGYCGMGMSQTIGNIERQNVKAITHKFRLYPSDEQKEKLLFILEQCRWLYSCFQS